MLAKNNSVIKPVDISKPVFKTPVRKPARNSTKTSKQTVVSRPVAPLFHFNPAMQPIPARPVEITTIPAHVIARDAKQTELTGLSQLCQIATGLLRESQSSGAKNGQTGAEKTSIAEKTPIEKPSIAENPLVAKPLIHNPVNIVKTIHEKAVDLFCDALDATANPTVNSTINTNSSSEKAYTQPETCLNGGGNGNLNANPNPNANHNARPHPYAAPPVTIGSASTRKLLLLIKYWQMEEIEKLDPNIDIEHGVVLMYIIGAAKRNRTNTEFLRIIIDKFDILSKCKFSCVEHSAVLVEILSESQLIYYMSRLRYTALQYFIRNAIIVCVKNKMYRCLVECLKKIDYRTEYDRKEVFSLVSSPHLFTVELAVIFLELEITFIPSYLTAEQNKMIFDMYKARNFELLHK